MLNVQEVMIDPLFCQGQDPNRLQVAKLLLAGYNNQVIANELNFSVKNIESIISKFFRKVNIITRGENARYINPRIKLLVHGLKNNWLSYHPSTAYLQNNFINRNQYLSLLLCAAGLSNRAISEFLCISNKTVESRFNTLFHQFGVSSSTGKQFNPRMRLTALSIINRILSTGAIIQASDSFDGRDWEDVITNRDQIQQMIFANSYSHIAVDAPYLTHQSNIQSTLEYAKQQQLQSQSQQLFIGNREIVQPENSHMSFN